MEWPFHCREQLVCAGCWVKHLPGTSGLPTFVQSRAGSLCLLGELRAVPTFQSGAQGNRAGQHMKLENCLDGWCLLC